MKLYYKFDSYIVNYLINPMAGNVAVRMLNAERSGISGFAVVCKGRNSAQEKRKNVA